MANISNYTNELPAGSGGGAAMETRIPLLFGKIENRNTMSSDVNDISLTTMLTSFPTHSVLPNISGVYIMGRDGTSPGGVA
jgi:hypothetical protein